MCLVPQLKFNAILNGKNVDFTGSPPPLYPPRDWRAAATPSPSAIVRARYSFSVIDPQIPLDSLGFDLTKSNKFIADYDDRPRPEGPDHRAGNGGAKR